MQTFLKKVSHWMTGNRIPSLMRWLLWFVAFGLVGCISGERLVNHSFEFDARWDSPGIEILDFRYGNSRHPGARNPDWVLARGESFQATGVSGDMLVGDSLYVKWRIKRTGEVYQDTVDLRSRLPWQLKNHNIRFIVKGEQLYVYLITPEKLNPNPCPSRDELRRLGETGNADDRIFSTHCSWKIIKLYPDQPKH